MLRLSETQAILTSFPWGRLETDGTFNDSIAPGPLRRTRRLQLWFLEPQRRTSSTPEHGGSRRDIALHRYA